MRLFLLAVVLVAAVGAAGADTTPPSTIAGFPAIEAVSGTVVSVTSQLNEPGVLYAVVLPRGATPPSSTETRARTGSGGTPAAASGVKDVLFPYTTVQLDIFGLAPTTDYDLYIVAEDDEVRLQHHTCQHVPADPLTLIHHIARFRVRRPSATSKPHLPS